MVPAMAWNAGANPAGARTADPLGWGTGARTRMRSRKGHLCVFTRPRHRPSCLESHVPLLEPHAACCPHWVPPGPGLNCIPIHLGAHFSPAPWSRIRSSGLTTQVQASILAPGDAALALPSASGIFFPESHYLPNLPSPPQTCPRACDGGPGWANLCPMRQEGDPTGSPTREADLSSSRTSTGQRQGAGWWGEGKGRELGAGQWALPGAGVVLQ